MHTTLPLEEIQRLQNKYADYGIKAHRHLRRSESQALPVLYSAQIAKTPTVILLSLSQQCVLLVKSGRDRCSYRDVLNVSETHDSIIYCKRLQHSTAH